MAYDRKGLRRICVEVVTGVTSALHRFTYDDYLCVARNREVDAMQGSGFDGFTWDPTESVATRPLMCNPSTAPLFLYCHDGNKNVSEIVDVGTGEIFAHYEYSSFGRVVLATSERGGNAAAINPYRFSSEYHDGELGLVYYNYRHYNPGDGRWIGRDSKEEDGGINLFSYQENNIFNRVEFRGTIPLPVAIGIAVAGVVAAVEYNALKYCDEYAEKRLPNRHATDAFKHCFVSCEMAKCLKRRQGKLLGVAVSFVGGVVHEAGQLAERFFGESSHTMAGSIADMKSNKVGLGVAWNDGDCGKGCECENTADNPM